MRNSFFSFLTLVTLSLVFYSWAMNRLSQEEESLQERCSLLEREAKLLEQDNLSLKEKVCSMNDPSAEEYLLRKELGLCPKNGVKIFFKHDDM